MAVFGHGLMTSRSVNLEGSGVKGNVGNSDGRGSGKTEGVVMWRSQRSHIATTSYAPVGHFAAQPGQRYDGLRLRAVLFNALFQPLVRLRLRACATNAQLQQPLP